MPPAPKPILSPADEALIKRWLHIRSNLSAATISSYERAGRRLLLWCAEQHLVLAELTEALVQKYFHHLRHPPAHWRVSRKVQAADRKPTQVLYGPMSARSLEQERILLLTLLTGLADLGLLARNPVRQVPAPRSSKQSPADKALSQAAWVALRAWTDELPQDTAGARLRWVVRLFYYTGLRRIEVRCGCMADFHPEDGQWYLRVKGKFDKIRDITVPPPLLEALRAYRASLGLAALPSPTDLEIPLIVPLTGNPRVLCLRRLNAIIDELAKAASLAAENPYIARELSALTPHRFRHTNATHRLSRGATLETVQDELGHSDPRTTRIYAKTRKEARIRDANLLD